MTVAELIEWLRTFEGHQNTPIAVTWEGQVIQLERCRVYLYSVDGKPCVLIDGDVQTDEC